MTYSCGSFLPLLVTTSPTERSVTAERPVGVASYAALPFWDLRQEEGQWWTYVQHVAALKTQEFFLVLDAEMCQVDDPECGAGFFS